MRSFFKCFFASFLAIIIALFVSIFIFAGIIGTMLSFSADSTISVQPNTTLVMELNGEIVDRTADFPFNPEELLGLAPFNSNKKLGLNVILKNLKKAQQDPNISGILIRPDELSAGLATVEEIRKAIIDFKTSGKYVISYANFYTQKAYYLATAADKIYMNPKGMLDFRGLSAQMMFFKKTLEKLGVEPQIVRYGKFKAAIESFALDKISPENQEQTQTYLNSIWDNMLSGISQTRGIPVEKLKETANSFQAFFAQNAIDASMIDGLCYYDEVLVNLKELSATPTDKELTTLNFSKYEKAVLPNDKLLSEQEKIAVIYAQGEIGMGKGNNTEIGVENISKALMEAREDDKVKAVVLRVNSPGGSVITSEIILREAALTKQVKPLIISMGDVAASGGYYISCASDAIIANPNTITGSIGVFGLFFNINKLLNNKLGVTTSTVTTSQHADFGSMTRNFTADEQQIMQQHVNQTYTAFVNHVTRARNKTFEDIDNIGQGRVWSGVDAKNIGLIDEFGGLNDAITYAANKVGIDNYRIIELPKQKDPLAMILESMGEGVLLKSVNSSKIDVSRYVNHILKAVNMQGIQARMEYDIDMY